MEDKGLISVIIPVYKVEEYLNKCVESVLSQTYSNLEVILVDDGSPDRCGRICDQYKEKDRRIKVIHQKNAGQAGARNAGLAQATGKYIGFVDSDDYIAADFFEILLRNLEANECDIAICGRYRVYDNGESIPMFNLSQPVVWNSHDAIKNLLISNNVDAAMWDKLFKRKLFEGIQFPLGYVSEDVPVAYKLFEKSKRIVHCGEALYYYLQRAGSLSHSVFSEKSMGLYYFYKDVFIQAVNRYPDLAEEAGFYYYKSLLYLFYLVDQNANNQKIRRELKREIIDNGKAIVLNRYLKRAFKIFAVSVYLRVDKLAINISSALGMFDVSLNK